MPFRSAGIGKGTAYDYFETKEEMIACALIYMMTGITSKINEGLIEKQTFEEKIQYLLDQTEHKMVERECFFRFVHLMTDSSICAQHLKKKTEENNQTNILPVNMIRKLLEDAIETGEIKNDFPIEYIVCTISAKVIAYVVCICTKEMMSIRPDELKPLILNSIIKEFK